jgi:glycosyltransferase involved in cell wall biosynthesis
MNKQPKILILLPQVPFVRGGVERLAAELCRRLEGRGAKSDVVMIPFRWEPKAVVIREALAWRLLDLDADLVIPLKFPAYFIRHPRKVVWLAHQFRQLYDFHGTDFSAFANTPPDHELRERLVAMDSLCLRESLAVYTISTNVAARLRSYNGIEGKPLLIPPMIAEKLHCKSYGDFLLSVGRLETNKRFDLLLRALAAAKGDFEIKIVGSGSEELRLKALAEELGLADRVRFLGTVDDETLASLYNNCRAVHYAPLDEDYGLVAAEAMKAAKPVITASDSGGVLELVVDGENGIVTAPEPVAQAEAISRLMSDAELCRKLGEGGAKTVSKITWDAVLDELMRWTTGGR